MRTGRSCRTSTFECEHQPCLRGGGAARFFKTTPSFPRHNASSLDNCPQQALKCRRPELLLRSEPVLDISAMLAAAFLKNLIGSLSNLRVRWFDWFAHPPSPRAEARYKRPNFRLVSATSPYPVDCIFDSCSLVSVATATSVCRSASSAHGFAPWSAAVIRVFRPSTAPRIAIGAHERDV